MASLGERLANWATNGRYGQAVVVQQQAAELLENLNKRAGLRGDIVDEASPATLSQRFSMFASAMDFRVSSALSAIFSAVESHRSEVIKAVETVRSFYLAVAIIDQIAEDALTPDVSTGEVVTIKSPKNKEAQKALDILEERVGRFDDLVNDIVHDLLYLGEYTLRPVVDGPGEENASNADDKGNDDPKDKGGNPIDDEPSAQADRQATLVAAPANPAAGAGGGGNGKGRGKEPVKKAGRGILAIHDDVDQARVVSITENGQITGYLTISDRPGGAAVGASFDRRVEWKKPHSYIKFTLGKAKMRVKLAEDPMLKELLRNNAEFKRKVPMYVRVGRSILFPVLSKIKELQLMEQLVPATKIQMLTAGTLVGMKVPGGFDIVKGFEAAREAENMVNKKIAIDTFNNQINVENILSTVGRIKILPQFGEMGTFQKYDYKPGEPTELLSSVNDLRRVILSSVGMPFELLFGADRSERKGEFLKRYARYLRRLKSIQQAVADGLKQIVEIHLVNSGVAYTPSEDIQIEFRNKLIQIDLLDELEFLDTTVGMLGNVLKFFGLDVSLMSKVTNYKELIKFLTAELRVLGLDKAIDASKIKDLEAAQKNKDDVGADTPDDEPNLPPNPPPATGKEKIQSPAGPEGGKKK